MTFRNSHSYSEPGLMITWWTWSIMSFVFKKKREGEGEKSDQIALGSYQSGSEKIWNTKKKKKSHWNFPHGENMYERISGRPIYGGPWSDYTESNKTSYF